MLRHLSEYRDENIRAGVAINENCPTDMLEYLAEHPDDEVRSHAAQNPDCTPDLLQRLSRDASEYVCADLTAHPNITTALQASEGMTITDQRSAERQLSRRSCRSIRADTSTPEQGDRTRRDARRRFAALP